MTNKEFLQKPMRIQKRIDALILQKQSFEELANSIPGGNYDQPVVQKTRSQQAPFIKWIDKIMEVEKKIDELTVEYEKAKEEVLAAIYELSNPDYQNILIMRYLNDYSWQTICTKMYVSLTTAKRWHWDALNSIKINVGP